LFVTTSTVAHLRALDFERATVDATLRVLGE
jgi:hypothetical protein